MECHLYYLASLITIRDGDKVKKVGIITYRDIADGQGRFLQAYALYSIIKELGYEPEIIDYYPKNITDTEKSIIPKIRRFVKNPKRWPVYVSKLLDDFLKFIYKKDLKLKRDLYENFIEQNIKKTNRFYGYESLENANLNYDAYICGSDQIWNPNFQGLDPAYYLKFAPPHKRIAYAPSLGTTNIYKDQRERLKQNLEGLVYLSLREKSGAKLIETIIGKDVKVVLDPTFLMPIEWWESLAEPSTLDKRYVLTFLFDNNKYPRVVAKEIAKIYGYEIVSIPNSFADLFYKSQKKVAIGPKEFVSLFKNASFVCTQSFHGVVLSIIFKRQFFTFERDINATETSIFARISDLLEMLNLENRILKEGEFLPSRIKEIDYSNVNMILNQKKQESIEYLKKALQEVIGI